MSWGVYVVLASVAISTVHWIIASARASDDAESYAKQLPREA